MGAITKRDPFGVKLKLSGLEEFLAYNLIQHNLISTFQASSLDDAGFEGILDSLLTKDGSNMGFTQEVKPIHV